VRALYVVFAVLVAAVVLTSGIAYSLLTRPPAFSIPVANITVTLPQGVPYRQLTTGTWNDRYPAWSPNGKSIAYVSDRGGLQALWIMDASGLHQRQLSYGSEMVACPSWSPDSSKIAFRALDGQTSEIRVFRLSDNFTLSVPGSGPDSVQASASWSPDSSRLAFFVTQTSRGSGGMMSGSGMSGNFADVMTWWFPGGGGAYSYPSGLWLLPVAFLSVMVVGFIVVGYQAVTRNQEAARPHRTRIACSARLTPDQPTSRCLD
jgi:hypothetical protein